MPLLEIDLYQYVTSVSSRSVTYYLTVKTFDCVLRQSPIECGVSEYDLEASKSSTTGGEGLSRHGGRSATYAVGSKSFRPDIQKPRQMENAVRDV